MKFLLISPKNRTTYNFRGELIKRIQEKGYDVIVTGPDRTDAERVEALGVDFRVVPVDKNGTSVVSDLKYMFALRKLMEEVKPDAVLGYTIKPVVYGALAAKMTGVKNINCLITGGGYTFTADSFKAKLLGAIVRLLYRAAFTVADQIIFQNSDDREEFAERGLVKREKTHIVHGSGVDLSHYEPRPFPQETRFFMLSRLLKSKGVEEYLQAAEIVKRKHPEVSFSILGKYEDKMQDAVPKETVERLIAEGVITRHDETHDVRPYYADCSVYVLPSYREGTPRTVLEAMAMERPIITTDTNGCRDTVEDGVTGFLVPVRNAEAIAEKMEWFIDHPEQIVPMGQASKARCEELFDVVNVNAEMLRIMKI